MAQTITLTRRNAGGVPDSTGVGTVSVTIVRDDTGATVYGPSSALITNPSDGVYVFDYSSLGLSAILTYTATFTSSLLGTIGTRKIEPADTSRTERGYRKAMHEAGGLGLWGEHAASQASTALNELYIAALVDDEAGANSYSQAHVYFTGGSNRGEQRRVKQNGFTPGTGRLLFHRSWDVLPAEGDACEVLRRLPAIRNERGQAGIRDFINRALEELPQIIRWEFEAPGDFEGYAWPVGIHTWLSSQVQIGRIYESTSGYPIPIESTRGLIRYDADQPYLELASPITSGTFQVELMIPGRRWIKKGGAWQQTAAGLQDDDDEALVDPTLLRPTALAHAFTALAEQTNPSESAYWFGRAEKAKAEAAQLRAWSQWKRQEEQPFPYDGYVEVGGSTGFGSIGTQRTPGVPWS